ncbi:MAG: hypothetical protein ABEJ24_00270 [Candidatus Magasanikbacteria bacterium]
MAIGEGYTPTCSHGTPKGKTCPKCNKESGQEGESSAPEIDQKIKEAGIAEAIFESSDVSDREGIEVSDAGDHNFDIRTEELTNGEEHISIVVRGDKVNQAFGLDKEGSGGVGTASEDLLSEEQAELIRELAEQKEN